MTSHHYSKLKLMVTNRPSSLISGSRNGTPATNLPPKIGLGCPKTREVVEVADVDKAAVAGDLNRYETDRV